LRIVDAKVIVTCPGRNFVTLKVVTDDGVTGVGDATLNGRELAVAAYLTEHVVPVLIGRDPARVEDTWQYLYRGAYWRRGPVTMSAIAAVDTALWDIKGKVAGLPVYQLLGGRSREGVTVYGHANGETVDEAMAEVAHYVELGYRAVRVQAGVPGWPRRTASGRTGCSTSRPPRRSRRSTSGRPNATWATFPRSSPAPGPSSAPRCGCCTTCTTGSRPSRPRGSAARWSPTR